MNHKDNKTREKVTIGFVILFPILFMSLTFVVIPFFQTIMRSFTHYNVIQSSKLVWFDNYINIIKDKVIQTSIKNTFFFTTLSTIFSIGIGFLLAWASSYMYKAFRYIILVLLLIVSITYILPRGIGLLFNNDISGYMNNYLIEQGKEPIQYLQNPDFLKKLAMFLPVLLGLGPMYFLFTLYFFNKGHYLKRYIHIGIILQVVISSFAYLPIMKLIGNPSPLYIIDTVSSIAYDYTFIRYELGYGSAVFIVMAVIMLFIIALLNFLTWLIFNYTKFDHKVMNHEKTINLFISILLFFILLMISLILMYPFIQVIFDSLKPLQEIYRFPPKLLPINPTLVHYKEITKGYNINSHLSISILYLLLSTSLLLVISILSGIGFSFLKAKLKTRLRVGLSLTMMLSPTIIMFYYHRQFNSIFTKGVSITFMSISFGVAIYVGSILYDNTIGKDGDIKQNLLQPKYTLKYTTGLMALSLLTAFSTWFNYSPVYMPDQTNKLSIFQYALTMTSGAQSAVYDSLYIINMVIPILTVSVCAPVLLYSLTKENQI